MKFRQKKTPANQNEGKNNFFFIYEATHNSKFLTLTF